MTDEIQELKDSAAFNELRDEIRGVLDDAADTISKFRYTCEDTGVVLYLQPISVLTLRAIQNDFWGMPQPPVKETKLGPKKVKRLEANPNDPEYLQRYKEWNDAKNERALIYVCTEGVINDPPEEDFTRLKRYLPGGDPTAIKYAWIVEQFKNPDEIGKLSEAIISVVAPTDKGISEAEDTFRSDD